ncbi:SDR family oxidoreductase [Patescibacteria group bacterium]|nr:SDR family oxidoreductase [Patescibacteria group bacterium]MCL5798038.1 SDR family oxidoreductase [Patescibacteria group bacterium]
MDKNKYNFSDLQDKPILIVGGMGLIGKVLAKGFSSSGSKLIIADVNTDQKFLEKVNTSSKNKVIFYKFDTTKEKSIDELIEFSCQKMGKIEVFINCSWPKTEDWSKNVEEMPYSSVEKNLAMHLGGYYHCTQKIAVYMKNKSPQGGNIINFSSIYGTVAPTFSIYNNTEMTSPSPYALIKGGVNMMTKYFASYFGKYDIRVNCISPGGVKANQNPDFIKNYEKLTPLGRMASPDDLVGPTLFLASDISGYITGHNLLVDGGWTIH